MQTELVTAFLGVSVLLYAVLAGADFGAGILECVLGRQRREDQRALITQAMGPVWEANHMWLILALVILFNGFPRAYTVLSVNFHVPLLALLLGIVLRGCAFTFRHYDPQLGKTQAWYSAVFAASSLLTPFMLGVVAGGMILGRISTTGGFAERFVAPWATWLSGALGLLVCSLFTFLAAVYLIGETADAGLRALFARRAKVANGAAVIAGLLVFLAAQAEGLPLAARFLANPLSLACMGLATVLLAPLWWSVSRHHARRARALAIVQVGLVLLGWYAIEYPVLIAGPDQVTLANAAAPAATMRALLWALCVGSLLIFPALFFLLHVFKASGSGRNANLGH